MGSKSKDTTSSSRPALSTSQSLFSTTKQFDPALATLFATSTAPKPAKKTGSKVSKKSKISKKAEKKAESSSESDNEDLSSIASEEQESGSEDHEEDGWSDASETSIQGQDLVPSKDAPEKSRRKRKRDDEDLESRYMQRLVEEEVREDAKREQERHPKRQKALEAMDEDSDVVNGEAASDDEESKTSDADDVEMFEIPKHESLITTSETPEFDKAHRTVFLSNVSSDAVTEKAAKKSLMKHMSSFLESLPTEKISHKIESLRFRSTAFSNQLPKKAAFAKKEVMDATTKSTNAYIVYTTKVAAREALKLNGTVLLDRHLRVDSVAHPAKIDHHKCVFVGNLGFVDDESAIQAANEEEGKRKQKKREPGDVEEGLWREFGKCGKVESVRVVRDAKTRVGKGIAYVQFTDENAVEAALLYNEKRFPPMLPRKLRVMRAKPIKRNAVKRDERQIPGKSNGIYNPKISAQQKSAQGRAGKMLGRAGAALLSKKEKSFGTGANAGPVHGIQGPESFVFEGHRAKSGSYVASRKKSSVKKKRGPPQNRSSKRAAVWKKAGGAKA